MFYISSLNKIYRPTIRCIQRRPIWDRAERHDFRSILWIFFSHFLFPDKKRGKKKRRMNSQNRDQKTCLSARSFLRSDDALTFGLNENLIINNQNTKLTNQKLQGLHANRTGSLVLPSLYISICSRCNTRQHTAASKIHTFSPRVLKA